MEESYFLAKTLVSSKYKESDEFYPLLLLALTALYYKYNANPEIVEDVFRETDIYIEPDTIKNIVKRHRPSKRSTDNLPENITGISSTDETITFDGNAFTIQDGNPWIACNNSDCSQVELLNNVVHELNHLIKAHFNHVIVSADDDISFFLRSGLNIVQHTAVPSNGDIFEGILFNTVDEVINTLQTSEMMVSLRMLDGIIPDAVVANFFDSLDKDELEWDFGYEYLLPIFKPLWQNRYFHDLIEDNILYGNIDAISEGFDSYVYDNSFVHLADYMDELDAVIDNALSTNDDEIISDCADQEIDLENKISSIISQFNDANRCIKHNQ